MNQRDQYYSRVEKIVGTHLINKRISVFNAQFVSKVVELLVSCGTLGWNFMSKTKTSHDILQIFGELPRSDNFEESFALYLQNENHFEDRWKFYFQDNDLDTDLVICAGTNYTCQKAYAYAQKKNVPCIIGFLFHGGTSIISTIFPGDAYPFANIGQEDHQIINRLPDWIDLNNQMANIAKALLLHGSEWERADINEILDNKQNTLLLTHPSWPWVNKYFDIYDPEKKKWLQNTVQKAQNDHQPADITGKHVLIVGAGSLGSIAADYFRILGANLTIIDCKNVSDHNPIRQLFSTRDIGKIKAFCLPEIMACKSGFNTEGKILDEKKITFSEGNRSFIGINQGISNDKYGKAYFRELLENEKPDLVVLVTAHQAEYRMTHVLRDMGIPHLTAGCYPRARWFEVITINGKQGPCFGCLKGHLYHGTAPSLTEEQNARYDSQVSEEGMVQAEPATRIETSRCVDTLFRIGVELLMKPEDQKSWFKKMINEERTFLIGGNYAEKKEGEEEYSFGIETPGGTALYGTINLIGSYDEDTKTCIYCGKTHEILIKIKPKEYGDNNDG